MIQNVCKCYNNYCGVISMAEFLSGITCDVEKFVLRSITEYTEPLITRIGSAQIDR